MAELLTAAQMKAIEAAAIASGAVTGLALMERAGAGVVAAVLAARPALGLTSGRAVVLCGPGNNGGDGFVVARLLAERGWQVEVFLYGDATRLPPDAQTNFERWRGLGAVSKWNDAVIESRLDAALADLVIDAVFGTGLTRPMPADTARTLHGIMACIGRPADTRPMFVAVDIPSGICADSGRNLEGAFPADLTVTFHRAKLGHYLSPCVEPEGGPVWSGKLVVSDIGLGAGLSPRSVTLVDGAGQGQGQGQGQGLGKALTAQKFSHGHALIVSGDHGRAGAARLAARGALRVGAGVVTVASPSAAMAENAARLDAIMLREVGWAEDFAQVLGDVRINALCLGPGMGVGTREAELVATALRHSGQARPVVLDADALTLLSGDAALFDALHAGCVLTPHGGEFARLFPDIAAKLAAKAPQGPAYSKVDASQEAAARAGCVVLFKGADTVVAHPDGRCAVNAAVYERAAPWLATAGSGDVLAGFITGLLARGFAPFEAACAGAWLHVECARAFGAGLIAEDLPETLPKVFRTLKVQPSSVWAEPLISNPQG